MARRGDQLREHILWAAKDVFLEMGFERASMDVVANRAETSKRSLYAHFESKEKLFLAVIEMVRGLLLGRLQMPGDYSDQPAEALALFCGQYVKILLYEGSIQLCRVSMAETKRFPEGAAQHFDVMFTEVHTRLSTYLRTAFGLSAQTSGEAAQRLMGKLLYPRLLRALFGVDKLAPSLDRDDLGPDFDLDPIRKAVGEVIASLQKDAG
jgi:AcrR family transcriptional regulator